MTDFTLMPKEIAETLEKLGCPLTEEQYLIMSGTLAQHQLMIEDCGLEKWLDQLACNRAKRQVASLKRPDLSWD